MGKLDLKQVNSPKPLLKWAGGKTQLLDQINNRLPKDMTSISKYFEPFVGGGAVFFDLSLNYDFQHVYLGDTNRDLILTYSMFKNNYFELNILLKNLYYHYRSLSDECKKKLFYAIRSSFNKTVNWYYDLNEMSQKNLIRAAQMIFLNKTCFNGLYRVNKKNEFNVPFANTKNPLIYDTNNFINVSNALRKVDLINDTYLKSEKLIDKNSFVYLDPPYRPINGKKSFEGYSKSDFNDNDQKELSKFCRRIDKKGAKFILSNSDPHNYDKNDNFFDELYDGFNVKRVFAKRFINSKGNKRGEITEILVSNY